MQTAVKDQTTSLAQLLMPQPAAQLPAVVDERAVKRDIQVAHDACLAIDRRIDLVFTGKGKHVDNLMSVSHAKSVRVGDGSFNALFMNVLLRSVFVASPAATALMTGFGAAAASDLAIIIAAIAPLTWVPAAAIRSARADRAAAVDIAKAAPLRATEDDIADIERFVASATANGSPLTLACASHVLAVWLDKGTREDVLTPAGVNRLNQLLLALPAPSPEHTESAKRFLAMRDFVAGLKAGEVPAKQARPELDKKLAAMNGLEREALASRWHKLLPQELAAALPASSSSDVSVKPPTTVVFAKTPAKGDA